MNMGRSLKQGFTDLVLVTKVDPRKKGKASKTTWTRNTKDKLAMMALLSVPLGLTKPTVDHPFRQISPSQFWGS